MKSICIVVVVVCLLFGNNTYGEQETNDREFTSMKNIIVQRVEIINKIIIKPEYATIDTWSKLSNPNDESELMFFRNSISDGTNSVYDQRNPKWKKLSTHAISESEPSALLHHLRMSLMSFNGRPGSNPPMIKVNNVFYGRENKKLLIVDSSLVVNNLSGEQTKLPSQITFEIGDSNKEIYLLHVIVDNHLVYGWWYGRK